MTRIANRDCGALVARREPFTGSNLQGGPRGTFTSFGFLPGEWRDVFYGGAPDYVVWSYAYRVARTPRLDCSAGPVLTGRYPTPVARDK